MYRPHGFTSAMRYATDRHCRGVIDTIVAERAREVDFADEPAARQAITQGGVSVNGDREADLDRRLGASDLLAGRFLVLRRGRRSYHVVDVR